MNAFSRLAIFGLLPLTVTACGGLESLTSFDDLEEGGDPLFESVEALERTPLENMRNEGSASYSGVAGFASSLPTNSIEEATAVAEIRLTADFGGSKVNGALTNFQGSVDDFNIETGRMDIIDGVIEENNLYADIGGEVTGGGERGLVDGHLSGFFMGKDAEAVEGILETNFIHVGSGEQMGVAGVFAAERN